MARYVSDLNSFLKNRRNKVTFERLAWTKRWAAPSADTGAVEQRVTIREKTFKELVPKVIN